MDSAALPFYPAGWPLALGAVAGALALLHQRLALAFCLAVPVLPLGNYALALALVYALAAMAWLALAWRDPGGGLFSHRWAGARLGGPHRRAARCRPRHPQPHPGAASR